MSVIGSNILAGASGQGGGYNLTKSLRFRSSASANLSRTPASATNQLTWTYSAWVKRGTLGGGQTLLAAKSGTNSTIMWLFNDQINISYNVSAVTQFQPATVAVLRDPSAWYHIVVVSNLSNATAANRIQIYVNGVLQTLSGTPPTQNYANSYINSTFAHGIAYNTADTFFDGYMSEVNFIDGQALTPSSFGANSPTTGVWQPKKYAGTYGTNGFYLPFTDVATTSGSNAGLGKDFSGNGNYWTTNNISVTAGSTYDSMTDVPTLTDETSSNYAVLNPVFVSTDTSISVIQNGNLSMTSTGSEAFAVGNMPMSTGKWYWEVTVTTNQSSPGVWRMPQNPTVKWYSGTNIGYRWYGADGKVYTESGVAANYSTYTNGDVLGFALDMNTGKVYFAKNNTWQGSSDPVNGTNPLASGLSSEWVAGLNQQNGSTSHINFGQRPFAYTPPTGFVALNTFNLPTPTIGATASTRANKYFDVLTYTGNGTNARAITGLNFQPDFVWVKRRNDVDYHNLFDSIRGATKRLFSNDTLAENTESATLQSFDANGFTVGTNDNVNANASPLVAWCWDANGAGVSNTSGTITSTVSANTTSGFSVVTYTGTGSNATVGHGLGVAPRMVIVKRRDNTGNWSVFHSNAGSEAIGFLNSTAAFSSPETSYWNGTSPTSSVFSVGTNSAVNASGGTYVAYVFAQVAWYSSIGRYTGNGSADGTFVYTGFRPEFILIKTRDSTGGWIMYDAARDSSNVVDLIIEAQSSGSESSGSPFADIDFLSNGFKVRGTSSAINTSSGAYMFMAVAENPFKYSLAR